MNHLRCLLRKLRGFILLFKQGVDALIDEAELVAQVHVLHLRSVELLVFGQLLLQRHHWPFLLLSHDQARFHLWNYSGHLSSGGQEGNLLQ